MINQENYKTLSNINEGVFYEDSKLLKAVNYFEEKLKHR